MFYSPEYMHLLAAERTTAKAIEACQDDSDLAQLVRALAAVVQLKREIRMRPKPKPVDVSTLPNRRLRPTAAVALQPLDPTAQRVA